MGGIRRKAQAGAVDLIRKGFKPKYLMARPEERKAGIRSTRNAIAKSYLRASRTGSSAKTKPLHAEHRKAVAGILKNLRKK